MIDDRAPNTGISKIALRQMMREAAALTGMSDGAPVGLDAGINERSSDVTAEHPCKQANNINDRFGAIRPDLPNIV